MQLKSALLLKHTKNSSLLRMRNIITLRMRSVKHLYYEKVEFFQKFIYNSA